MTVSSLLYVPNSLDNCVLVPAGEGAEELWPNVLGTNATEVALGALVGGPGQRGPIQDVESRGPDSLPTRVICSDGSGLAREVVHEGAAGILEWPSGAVPPGGVLWRARGGRRPSSRNLRRKSRPTWPLCAAASRACRSVSPP